MANRQKNESRQDRRRSGWKPRFRRRMERKAESILAMNTDFHSRLKSYRAALLAALTPVAMAR